MGEKLEEKGKMRADIVSADSSTANVSQYVMQNKNDLLSIFRGERIKSVCTT